MKIKAVVLEVKSGVFEGSPWKSITARVDGKLIKFKVLASLDLTDVVDKEVELECDIFGTASQSAYLKVVNIT